MKKCLKYLVVQKKSINFASIFFPRKLNMNNLIQNIMRKHFLLSFALFCCAALWAVDPSTNLVTYYANIDGKATDSNDNLRTTLCSIISTGYTTIGYSSLPNSVYAASSDPSDFYEGSSKTMEDIYSSYPYNSSQDGSSATTCGMGWNKEHTVPQSWFGKASPMVSDAHHIFPTDIRMNSCRSNYPYGENNASKYCSSYGYGHLGTSTFSGYTGQVFDPGSTEDCGGKCYRGDLARVYFYMATRYRTTDFTSGTGYTSFTYTNGVADLTDYMKNLMLKWHREDPVSEKELKRNNAIYAHQKNRNPFVDYPCLVEYIWGDKKGETVSLSSLISGYVGVGTDCCSTDPTLTVSSSSITIGPIATSSSTTQTFTVTGANLTGSISITKNSGSSSYITVNPTSITSGYNGTTPITITYNAPASAGTHTATLTISSTGATPVTVNITASCAASYTATWMADGSQVGTSYAASGTRPDVPASNPTNCSASRVFVGWTATSGYSGNSAPGDLFTTTAPTITTDKTFYAVYADKSTSAGGGTGSETLTCSAGTIDNNTMRFNTTNFSVEHAKGISANFASYSPWRIYNGNTVTISGSFSITSVVITCGSNDYAKVASNAKLTPTGGGTVSASASSTTCTIAATGTVTSLVISPSAQTRWSEIKINYSGGGTTTYSNYSTQCTASLCTLSNITLNTSSVLKSFAVGDAFNYTGLVVTANYSDCASKTVTPTSVSSPDMSTTGNKTVTVSYTESGTTKTATYTITVEAAPEYTVTFMNMGGTHTTRTGTAGSAISAVSEPTACAGYTFEGWSTSQYAVDNTVTPSLSTPTTIPVGGATYYAVYSKTEGSGSSSTSEITASTTLISGSTSGYTFATGKNGGSSNPTYNSTGRDVRLYAKNQITISASSTITQIVFNLSTQGEKRLAPIKASEGTIATQNSGDKKVTWTGSATSVTFTVGGNATYGTDGASKAGQLCFTSVNITSGSGSSTTYHTTEPDCTCTATITATTDDDSMGTVSVTTP